MAVNALYASMPQSDDTQQTSNQVVPDSGNQASPASGGNIFDQYEAGLKQQSAPKPSTSTSTPATPASSGNVFDQYEAGLAKQSQQKTASAVPGQIKVDDPNDNFLEQQAKKVAAVGAGVGEDVLDAASLGAKVLHLPHQTIDSRLQELKDDNADNPGLRDIGRAGAVVAPALAVAAPIAGAALGGLSEGAAEEWASQLAAHGVDGKAVLNLAIKKGMKGVALAGVGHLLGLSGRQIAAVEAVAGML
jgi:hypothetical protein